MKAIPVDTRAPDGDAKREWMLRQIAEHAVSKLGIFRRVYFGRGPAPRLAIKAQCLHCAWMDINGHTQGDGSPVGAPLPPTLEEVKVEASVCGQPAEEAERFFNHWAQETWQRKGKPLDWRANLRTWTPKRPARSDRRQSSEPAKRQRWQIQNDIDALKARMAEVKEQGKEKWKDQFGTVREEDKLTPEAKRKVAMLQSQKAKLLEKFDAAPVD